MAYFIDCYCEQAIDEALDALAARDRLYATPLDLWGTRENPIDLVGDVSPIPVFDITRSVNFHPVVRVYEARPEEIAQSTSFIPTATPVRPPRAYQPPHDEFLRQERRRSRRRERRRREREALRQ